METLHTTKIEIKSLSQTVKITVLDSVQTTTEISENINKSSIHANRTSKKLKKNIKRVFYEIDVFKTVIELITAHAKKYKESATK